MKFLKDLTILDLSSLLPCPFAAHLLAKMGARVIKVESPNRPDPAREFGHRRNGPGIAYQSINSNKELVWLDLKQPPDREKLYDLVRTSHGAIEGYRPDVKRRLGIDYETLSKVNPSFVLCSASGFDARGPLAERAGHDINFVSLSGILGLTRGADNRPVMPGVPLADIAIAYAASLRFVAALHEAKITGRGCHVEVSIEEALIESQWPFLNEFKAELEDGLTVSSGSTLVTGKYPCYSIYYGGDGGYFAVGALEPKFWQTFCGAIGRTDLIEHQFATGDRAAWVKKEIEGSLAIQTFDVWKKVFSELDCCVEPVLSVEEVIARSKHHGL